MLVFVGNPTQYHSPLFRMMSQSPELEIEVMFGDEIGAKPFYNAEVMATIEWDIPVLEGYSHRFFRNHSSPGKQGFWSRNNPGMFGYVLRSNASFVLLHGYNTLSSWYVYVAAVLSGKKIIWRGETVRSRANSKKVIAALKALILPAYFRACHKVLYSCTANRDHLQLFLRGQEKKLQSFPCAVDNAFFRQHKISDEEEKAALRAELGIPGDHMVLVTCSRLTRRKRTYLIVEAMGKMPSRERVTLLIIGGGPEQEPLKALAQKLGVNLIVTGFVGQKRVATLLSISDIFVLLSEYDASPKALNEAMNFPMPMIVSDGVGTSADLVKDDINGHIYLGTDSDSLSEIL
ncbi:glycosyltransferase family 4 protein, partial [bacterium AH-315-P15]|nr:glycosyltransferase family 4 protein [bacterium AH-315-P15]